MRTDVKIGIGVGLFVVVLAVIYFVFFPDGKAPAPGPQPEAAENEDAEKRPPVHIGLEPLVPSKDSPGAPAEPAGVIVPKLAEAPAELPGDTVPLKPVIRRPSWEAPEGGETGQPRIALEFPVLVPLEEPGVAGPPAGERTYVVQPGDAGFWAVAKKVYGEGHHWARIARANPAAESKSLRVGQKLIIPALPAEMPARADEGPEPIIMAAEGRRIYTVQDGDAGFWGVAEKAYGSGKHWSLIARANPEVDSSSLRPGQKLVILPLPRKATPAGLAARKPDTAGQPDRNIYVVQSGDAGFWAVAEKVYGHGKHWRALAKANPDADPNRLQPGQRLLVPELTEAARDAGVSRLGRPTGARIAPPAEERATPAEERYVRPPLINMSS